MTLPLPTPTGDVARRDAADLPAPGWFDQPGADLACAALRWPGQLVGLSLPQWDLLLRQARRADVLARVAALLQRQGLLAQVSEAPRQHLQVALSLAQAQQDSVGREIRLILEALRGLGVPVVLLKGAAYVAAGLPPSAGRLFSDTDILVPRDALAQVETCLIGAGWLGTHHDAYDQRYYREWMHEIPPMQHRQRQTVIDVHHNILPLVSRRPPDAARLLAEARPLPDWPGGWVLSPPDMVLHSAVHLLYNDELSHGLRDLSDLDLLLRHFGAEPAFWPRLLDHADRMGQGRTLHHVLWAVQTLLGTPVPASVSAALRAHAPPAPLRPVMRALWRRGLRTPHAMAALPGSGTALFLLYLRAHWLRMPPFRLIRHLSYKSWKRLFTPAEDAAGTAGPA